MSKKDLVSVQNAQKWSKIGSNMVQNGSKMNIQGLRLVIKIKMGCKMVQNSLEMVQGFKN